MTLRYDRMVENALRGVVREAIETASREGLPGDHHFYVTFRTPSPGVRLSDAIRARHPDEMTIVLQHQFWGLESGGEAFEVTLSFSAVSERLRIPYAAVTGFADPSVKFMLQFQVAEDEGGEPFELEELEDEAAVDEPAAPEHAAPPSGDGKVVALDAWRKK